MMQTQNDGFEHSYPDQEMLRFRTCKAWPEAQYFMSLPKTMNENTPVLVSVHGISRNAREHAQTFAPLCSRLGWVVVAPLFSARAFTKYQQLGYERKRSGPRSDLALNAILDEITATTGVKTDKVYMFGFSGGGQFVHRYALVHPQRVVAAALGAPGWYTFPDPDPPFPRGLRIDPTQAGFRIDGKSVLHIPTAVFVGAEDIVRDETLNTGNKIDDQQGRTRVERALRWIEAMQAAARSNGLDTHFEFRELEGCGHSFTQCMAVGRMDTRALEFLIGAAKSGMKSALPRGAQRGRPLFMLG